MAVRFWVLSAAVFAAGFFVSSLCFPCQFEWRYGLISTLLSYKDNPGGYLIATSTLIVAPLLIIPVFKEISRVFGIRNPGLAKTAFVIAVLGIAVAALVGIEKMLFARLTNQVHKLHERIAGTSFCLLILCGILYGILYLRSPAARWTKALMVALVLAAPLGGLGSKWYLQRYRPGLGWVGPHWKDLDISVFLSFALWQWVFVISSYVAVFLWLQATKPMRSGSPIVASPADRLELREST